MTNNNNGDDIKDSLESDAHLVWKTFVDLFSGSKEIIPCLPQFATAPQRNLRRKIVQSQQKIYQYVYNTNALEAPYLKVTKDVPFPTKEYPKLGWFELLIGALIPIVAHTGEEILEDLMRVMLEIKHDTHNINLLKEAIEMLSTKKFDERPVDINSYALPFGGEEHLPPSANDYLYDAAFARYRLTGPNPMTIAPCTDAAWTQINLKSVDNAQMRSRIKKAYEDARLYVSDLSALASLPNGENVQPVNANADDPENKNADADDTVGIKTRSFPKYNNGVIALFELPTNEKKRARQSLVPLAIQVVLNTTVKANENAERPPLFTCEDDPIQWKIAKAIYNSADGDYHEAIVHLANTHLICEPFMIATHRHLPPQHPLFVLLEPHFEGTAFINNLANTSLIAPPSSPRSLSNLNGGGVSVLVSAEITAVDELVGKEVLGILGADFSFPARLKRRNMGSDDFHAPFPYRDDGLLIWNAVHHWVDDYLAIYYGSGKSGYIATTNAIIEADKELQAWMDELGNYEKGGRVGWIHEHWAACKNKFVMLVRVVSAVIFTASAQHAAVNFPQKGIESYVPAFPLAMYRDAPRNRAKKTEQDYLDFLPPLQAANTQRKLLGFLGGVYYTTLGVYGANYFIDARVSVPLKKFTLDLEKARNTIKQRNIKRVALWNGHLKDIGGSKEVAENWAYDYLLPQNIPQSINI